MRSNRWLLCALAVSPGWCSLAAPPSADFQPDPKTVQRSGPAYRYPQAGWIVLHIEGEPYERGVQHGKLMSSEIAAHLRCFATMYSATAPADGWPLIRMVANANFLRGFDREYLEEMRGIADGASAAGARLFDRPVDLIDIAALNVWAEIMTLDGALRATPTGLEGIKFPETAPEPIATPPPSRCSAFAATGPATADGKIVFGHITMFSLYPSGFYNVWLDIQPSAGHRVLMQSYPGGIQSAMDYYMSSAGLLVAETTIDQTRFNAGGSPLASRIRKALQYGDSIDEVVSTLESANNGLYTNEWLIGDTKSNEIAMFELGTKATKLYRSSRNEWFGGTEGFYWGCNNTKDLAVRLETVGATNDRPANMVWAPSVRDVAWLDLYTKHKSKIGEDFAREAFTTPPICAFPSVDAKFTTTALAKNLKSHALFGPPLGKTWEPTEDELRRYKEIRPLISCPWTVLHAGKPTAENGGSTPVDLTDDLTGANSGLDDEVDEEARERREQTLIAKLVWRGTLLPKSDADIWLAAAFADYHEIVSREKGLLAASKKKCLCASDLEKAAQNISAARVRYLRSAAEIGEIPLSKTAAQFANKEWYHLAAGKGVLVLNELRRTLGDGSFIEVMDSFGFEHAGAEVTTSQFVAHAAKTTGRNLDDFFDYWLNRTGLPRLKLTEASFSPDPQLHGPHGTGRIRGVLRAGDGPLPANVEMTVETSDGEHTSVVTVDPADGAFQVDCEQTPTRLTIDLYGRVAKANGGTSDILSYADEPRHTVIVYGTIDETHANREAAMAWQKALRTRWSNVDVPMKTDSEITDAELREHHLILIGRPTTNRLTDRFRDAIPVSFGPQSFTVRGKTYAHMDTAVIAAARHPLNDRYCLTVAAGLSPAATYRSAQELDHSDRGTEIKILIKGRKPLSMVAPAPELAKQFLDPSAGASR